MSMPEIVIQFQELEREMARLTQENSALKLRLQQATEKANKLSGRVANLEAAEAAQPVMGPVAEHWAARNRIQIEWRRSMTRPMHVRIRKGRRTLSKGPNLKRALELARNKHP